MTKELFRVPDDGWRHELVRGGLRRMALGGFRRGAVVVKRRGSVGSPREEPSSGRGLRPRTGFVLGRNPDTVLTPDVAFVRRGRIPATGPPATFWEGAPDLAVEVTSPGDAGPEAAEKAALWLSAGTRVVWAVDPRRGSVTIHEPGATPRLLSVPEVLDGAPLLPAFRLPVADIFA